MIDPIRPERISADVFLARRRSRLERLLGRRLAPLPPSRLPASHRRFLREEAEELYWNELSWASLAGRVDRAGARADARPPRSAAREARTSAADDAERTFAAFLTFVDGLLLRETGAGARGRATPRPGVVEEVLRFLAERCLDRADAADGGRADAAHERALTERLIDLVLYRLHALPTTARPAGRPPRSGDSGAARVGEDG